MRGRKSRSASRRRKGSDTDSASTASASDHEADAAEPKLPASLLDVAIAEKAALKPRPTPYVLGKQKTSLKGPGPRWHVPGELTVTSNANAELTKAKNSKY